MEFKILQAVCFHKLYIFFIKKMFNLTKLMIFLQQVQRTSDAANRIYLKKIIWVTPLDFLSYWDPESSITLLQNPGLRLKLTWK